MPKVVLYIESGVSGGGSFESLYQHLKVIDRTKYSPVVVFLNYSSYYHRIQELDIPCYIVVDFLYSKKTRKFCSAIIYFVERFKMIIDLYFSQLSLLAERTLHFSTIKDILSIIRENRIDLIHTNNQVHRDLYAVQCAQISGVPCISHLRSFFSLGFNKKKADFSNEHITKYIAYSESVAEHWIDKGIDSSKVEVINNGIGELSAHPFDLHGTYNIPQDRKTIGIVGKIIPVRGHAFLLNAFASLLIQKKDVHLIIVGDGETCHVNRIKKLADHLGLTDHVTFTGYHHSAQDIIASLDILVLPYAIEPFGRVLLEAWSLKTPVILTNVWNIKDIATDGKNAIFVNFGDCEQLANQLHELIEDKCLREKMVDNGRDIVNERFLIQEYQRKVGLIYEEIHVNK